MHEHETIMLMGGEFCPVCGKYVKDIPTKKEEPKKPKPKKSKTKKESK